MDERITVRAVSEERSSRGEIIKFILLAVVLVGAILVVALSRSLIFGRIVPAVMGEGQPGAPLVEPVEVDPNQAVEPVEEESVGGEPGTELFIPAVGVGEDAVEAPAETEAAEEAEPAGVENSATPVPVINHTVRPGENLTAIARSYGVPVDAIITANNITNPNHIEAGTVLLIPPP